MLSRVRSVKHFFGNALSRAHRGVLVPTSLWLGPIDSLPFATVVFWLHLKIDVMGWRVAKGQDTGSGVNKVETTAGVLQQSVFTCSAADSFQHTHKIITLTHR